MWTELNMRELWFLKILYEIYDKQNQILPLAKTQIQFQYMKVIKYLPVAKFSNEIQANICWDLFPNCKIIVIWSINHEF